MLQPNVTKNICRWLSLYVLENTNPQNSSIFPGKWNDGELDLAVKKDEFLCTKRGQLGGLPFQSILSGKRFKTKGKQPFLTSWTGAKLTLATQASVDRSLARLMAPSSWNNFRKTYPTSQMFSFLLLLNCWQVAAMASLLEVSVFCHFRFSVGKPITQG